MKLNWVQMTNFGIFKDKTKIDFDKGLYVFSGDNGEGKSTVFKAISMLLFDKYSGKLENYINWEADNFLIKLSFSHKQQDFEIGLDYSEKESNRYLINITTDKKYTSSKAITETLSDIIDTKRALFGIMSFEGEIDLINTTPSERREYLKRVYDLSFKSQLEKIDNDLKDSSDKSISILSEKKTLEDQEFEKHVLERLPFSKEVFKEKKLNTKEIRENLKSEEEKKYVINNELKEIGKTKEEILEIKEQIKNKELSKNKSWSYLESLTAQEEKLKNDDFSNLKEEYKTDELEKEVRDYESNIVKLNNDLTESEKELLNYGKLPDIESIQNKHSVTEEKLLQLDNKKSHLESGRCPTCGSLEHCDKCGNINFSITIDELFKEKEQLEKTLKELKNEIESYKEQKDEKENIEENIENIQSGLKLEQQKMEYALEKIEDMRLFYEKSLTEHTQRKESELIKISENKQRAEETIEDIEKEIEILNSKKHKLLKNISTIDDKEKELDEVVYRIEKIEDEIEELENEIENYKKVEQSNDMKKELNKELEQKEKERNEKVKILQMEYEQQQLLNTKAEKAKKILGKEFPSFVISKLIKELEVYSNEFLQTVYPKYKLKFVEQKNALGVVYGNNDMDVKLASGFEKQVFSFAYKYALGKMQEYGILLLDEVDSAASESNSINFYKTLGEMKELFNQIILISHKSSTKEILSNDYSATIFEIQNGKIV